MCTKCCKKLIFGDIKGARTVENLLVMQTFCAYFVFSNMLIDNAYLGF